MLAVENLVVHYGEAEAVRDISLEVGDGELVCLLGPNGAGKTTLLNTICGLLRPSSGMVNFSQENITGRHAAAIQRKGISQVPEGRKIFPTLTVEDNLRVGAYTVKDKARVGADLKKYTEMFPVLARRRNQKGGSLSGGEQQVVAIVRALMSRPKLILFDEPSLGLAPLFVKRVYEIIKDIHGEGTSILLVEQNARMALGVAARAYIMDAGEIVISGRAEDLSTSEDVKKAYLGE